MADGLSPCFGKKFSHFVERNNNWKNGLVSTGVGRGEIVIVPHGEADRSHVASGIATGGKCFHEGAAGVQEVFLGGADPLETKELGFENAPAGVFGMET